MSEYTPTSPYYLTPINDNELGFMVNRKIPKLQDDVVMMITQTYHMRPDLLAYDLYGTSKLWWVFANRNPNTLINPLGDFITGTQIYVPKLESLREVLGF